MYIQSNETTNTRKKNISLKWHVAKYGYPYTEFVLCSEPILSEHTHQEQWAVIYAAAPGE